MLGYCIVDRYFIAVFGSTVCMCLSSTIPDVEQQQQCRRIGYRTTAGDGIHFRWCFDLSPERYLTTTRAIQLRAFVVNGGQLPTIAASGINSYLHLHNKSFCVTCVDRLCRGHENARNYWDPNYFYETPFQGLQTYFLLKVNIYKKIQHKDFIEFPLKYYVPIKVILGSPDSTTCTYQEYCAYTSEDSTLCSGDRTKDPITRVNPP